MKNILIGAIALVVVGLLAFLLLSDRAEAPTPSDRSDVLPVEPDGGIGDGAEPLDDESATPERSPEEVIGQSAAGTEIVAHHFGTGATEILFVGGTHSGFAPNTVAVAEQLRAALAANEIDVPDNVTVTVITNLNPDATRSPNTLAGRLNKNGVDLNRNFDCDWDAEGLWNNTTVSGGAEVFSEPEARALRDYVASQNLAAVVVYYAADGGVYASNCGGGSLAAETASLTNTYARAAGYTANEEFDAYAVSGDMTNWLAKKNIPAIGVLLSDYTNAEWTKNRAGVEAVLNFYAN